MQLVFEEGFAQCLLDLTLTRLNALKHSLRPEHSRAIADINRHHQRHFHFHTHEHH